MINVDTVKEYRGVEGLVFAEIIEDTAENFSTGTPFIAAAVAELTKETEVSNEAHYYNNYGAIVVSSTGDDVVTISASVIPYDVQATLTGQIYDATKGAFFEGKRVPKYFAMGYITYDTDGEAVYVWRLKGRVAIGGETHNTIANNTDANGQELTFTGVRTNHPFEACDNEGANSVIVETAKDKAVVTNFFSAVVTPDTLVAKVPATGTLTVVQAENTTVTVAVNGNTATTGAVLTQGDAVHVLVTGGTVTVNGNPFTSGKTYYVTSNGNCVVVSTASA